MRACRLLPALSMAAAAFVPPAGAQTLTCEETAERHAHHLAGEVAGSRGLYEGVGDDWAFALVRLRQGWAIRLLDSEQRDLTAITPPLHGPNARDIEGWHFRNADNTGPNDGSVNAPQHLRLFEFTPSAAEPEVGSGRGWFRIDDFGLADLEPGMPARMVYLKFFGCLVWPKTPAEMAAEADFNRTEYLPEEVEQFAACGLSDPYRLDAFLLPRMLSGDIDGDDSLDLVAPIVRQADGMRGIAVCRAGTWLDVLGVGQPVWADLDPGYLDRVEVWSLRPTGPDAGAIRQELILERIEKDRIAIAYEDGRYVSTLEFRFVEGE